jgi:type I restriction enzyme S subunit
MVPLHDVTRQIQDAVTVAAGASYSLLGVKWYAAGPFVRETVTKETSKATKFYRVSAGQFIYNRMFAWKGSFGLVGEDLAGTFVSSEFPLFETDRARLLPEFLMLHFRQPSVWAYIERVSTGTTASRNRWKEKQFRAYSIALPPPDEQRRIVDLVATIDDQVRCLDREEVALRSVRNRWALRATDVEVVRIGDVSEVSQGRGLPKAVQGQETGNVSWFKIADMTTVGNADGYVRAKTRLSKEEVQALGGTVIPVGAVVFPRVGEAVKTEKKRILDVPAAVDENHLVLTPKSGVAAEYLLAAIEALRLSDLVRTGAVPSLNMGLIRKAPLRWSVSENEHLPGSLRGLRNVQRSIRAERESLIGFRRSMLNALLSHEIAIPETYDRFLGKAV